VEYKASTDLQALMVLNAQNKYTTGAEFIIDGGWLLKEAF